MRLSYWLPLLVCLGLLAANCSGRAEQAKGDRDAIDLGQSVTSDRRPQDPVFVDFEKNWRQFISTNAELARPVKAPDKAAKTAWEPIVVAECVNSQEAKAMMPQVTLTWNDPVEPPRVRVDLAIHHNGFGRNAYSSALSSPPAQRFALPSNSALVNDAEAVILTGPALFPKLMELRVEAITDRDTARRLWRQTLVLRDLGEGLTYQLRLSSSRDNSWVEERAMVFLTPVCPGAS